VRARSAINAAIVHRLLRRPLSFLWPPVQPSVA
jgi:hypothetical protein